MQMRWGLFALLLVSVWINYMDRGNLGVAAPVLAPDLGLPPEKLGLLLSAFFFTYAFLQPVAGWLVDRFDVYRLYAVGFAVWSVAMAAGGFATGLATLFISRLVLGVGESIAYPAYSRILATDFPEQRRGLGNALIDLGSKGGSGLGTLLGGLAIARFGWRAFFIFMGLASLVWLIPWLRAIPAPTVRGPQTSAATTRRAAELLVKPQAWATFLGLFCYNYAFYFLLNWLPSYLVQERKMSMDQMAVVGSLPYVATAVASLLCGVYSDRLIAKGRDASKVRKRFAVVGMILSGTALAMVPLTSTNVSVLLLIAAFAAAGVFSSNAWAITQRLAGPQASGTWTGFQNAFANLGGIASPLLTGYLVSSTGGFREAFLVSAGALIAGAFAYGLMGRIDPIPWREE